MTHAMADHTSLLRAKHVTLPIIAVMMVIGNAVLIWVTMKTKTLRTVTNYLITTLAVSDLLMGGLVLPMLVAAEEGAFGGSPLACLIVFCFAITEVLISCLILMAIAVERYIAIKCPLKHHMLLSSRNGFIIITFCCVYSIFVGFLPMLGWNALPYYNATSGPFECRYENVVTGSYAAFMYPGHFIPLWILLITLYGQIYLRTRNNANRSSVRRLSLSMHPTRSLMHNRRAKENWRALRILVVVVGYFLISWLGLVVWFCALFKGFSIEHAYNRDPPLPYWFYNTAVTLAFGNSAINPFIYGLGNRSVRRAFFETIKCKSRTRMSFKVVNLHKKPAPLSKRNSQPIVESEL